MPTLDPLSLRLFVSVAEAGTIAAAAEREHIAAAAVSKRISEIEATLGVTLLRRTNKGVAPTAAGERLVTLAHRALHQLDDIAVQMRDYASGVSGLIRIAANVSSVVQFLPREIESFAARHPRIQIQLEEKPSTGVVKAVADNAVDIGIFTSVPHGYDIQTFPFRHDRLALVAPAGHALAPRETIAFAETLDFEYVGLPADTAISQQLTRAAHALGRSVNLRIQVTSYDAQCLMIAAGLGLGVMPLAVAQQQAASRGLAIVALTDAWAERDLLIAVRSLDALPVSCRLLIAHLRGERDEADAPGTAIA
ncbi:MAG TPA: LysR substrate-binding domain-containing protein [Paraburkholderia sp.]|jgi:DNA-binding transcriptional LysR family regulator|nr:LysR substrate-binding domain-containing protein [Paraburkholderia sp.]